jgi:hypothetical protein
MFEVRPAVRAKTDMDESAYKDEDPEALDDVSYWKWMYR